KLRDDFYLRGVLRCDHCSEIMTASASKGKLGKRYGYYHCNHCKQQRESAQKVNDAFSDLLESLQFDSGTVQLYTLLLEQALGSEQLDSKKEVSNLQMQLDQLNTRIEKMQDLLLDGKLDSEEYVRIKTRYSIQVDEIKAKIRNQSVKT